MREQALVDGMEMRLPRLCVSRTRLSGWRALLRFAKGRAGVSNWLTLLCLGLVLLSGTIQAEHSHPASPGSPDTHASCSLCATAHVGFAAAPPALLLLAASVIGHTEPRRAQAAFPAPRHFDLYTRPPPTGPTLA